MNGPYPEITNTKSISFSAKLFFKTFISLIKAKLLICMAGGRTDIILGFFEDGRKFANENTSIKYTLLE